MSIAALNATFELGTDVSGSERMILVVLANFANEDGYAWPKISTIAEMAGLSQERTVTDALTRLEAKGLIDREVNGWAGIKGQIPKRKRPNLYRLAYLRTARDAQSLSTGVSSDDRPAGVPSDDRRWGAVSRQAEPSIKNHHVEPNPRQPSRVTQEGRNESQGEGGWGFNRLNDDDLAAVATARQNGWTDQQIQATAGECRTNPDVRQPRGLWRYRLTNEDPPRANLTAVTETLIHWTSRGRPDGLHSIDQHAADLYATHKPIRDACRNGSADDIRRAVNTSLAMAS